MIALFKVTIFYVAHCNYLKYIHIIKVPSGTVVVTLIFVTRFQTMIYELSLVMVLEKKIF